MISDRNQTSSQPNQLSSSSQQSGGASSTSSTNGQSSSGGGWPLGGGYGQLNGGGLSSLMGPSLFMGSGVGGVGGGYNQFNPYGSHQFNPLPGSGLNFNHLTSGSVFGNPPALQQQVPNNPIGTSNGGTSSSVGGNNQSSSNSGGGNDGQQLSNFDQAVKYAAEANAKANLDKDYYEAIKLYGLAISMDSSDHRFYLNRSYCYAQLELYQLALDDAIQAIALNPNLAKCYFRKGQALAGLKKFREAEKSFLEVLRLEPGCQETHHELNMNRILALSSAGYNESIAHWAANKFGSIDEAIQQMFNLMNNPTTASIINNPSLTSSAASDTVARLIGNNSSGLINTSSSSSRVQQQQPNIISDKESALPSNRWDSPAGFGGGNNGSNYPQQQTQHQYLPSNNQKLSPPANLAPGGRDNNQPQNGMNQKSSDINSVSQQQRSSSFNQQQQQQQQSGVDSIGNFITGNNGFNAFGSSRDTFGILPPDHLIREIGGGVGLINNHNPASSSSGTHNFSSASSASLIPNERLNGIGSKLHDQFSSMRISPAVTPPTTQSASIGNHHLHTSAVTSNGLSGSNNGTMSSKSAIGPIGRPLTGHYHGSGSESISPAVSSTDSNTDTSSPSLDGISHHHGHNRQQHQQQQHHGGNSVSSAFEIKSVVNNGLGSLIGNNNIKVSNGFENGGSTTSKSGSGTGAWGNSGTAFSYSDIVKKKPTAAEIVASNNAANGGNKSSNGSVSSSGDDNVGNGKSGGWSSVVESNGSPNSWSAADGSKSTPSTTTTGGSTTAASQSAAAASKRPTNIWGYNGLRVANVSSTASKSTLHSMFSKFGRIKLIERINNKNVENQLWVFYDNEKSPVEVIAKYQGSIVPGISMNSTTGLKFFFAATDDQKDLKFSRPKQPQDNRGECYYWRTTNCFSRESCSLLHIPACKNIDAQVWMKMNRDPAAAAAAAAGGSTPPTSSGN